MKKSKVRRLSIRQKFMLIAVVCILVVAYSISGIYYSNMERETLTLAAEKAEAIGEMSVNMNDLSGDNEICE